jgi:hypothetical protein
MATQGIALDAELVFHRKTMRVTGRLRLEGASGQISYRYQLSDGTGAPVVVEEADGRYALLRPFPPAAEPQTGGNTISVGKERYTLVGTRRLKILEALGQAPGGTARTPLLLSGMFEGPKGTLMRELAPGSQRQTYFLVKPLRDGELLTAAQYAVEKAAARRAAGERDD